MAEDSFDGRLKRREFLGVSAAAGASLFLSSLSRPLSGAQAAPMPTTAGVATMSAIPLWDGPVSAEEAGGIEVLIEMSRKEGVVSMLVPMHSWTNYGQLFEKFRIEYPFLAIAALIQQGTEDIW